jgi:hypothetical protein
LNSPRKLKLLEQANFINALDQVPTPKKQRIVGKLMDDYAHDNYNRHFGNEKGPDMNHVTKQVPQIQPTQVMTQVMPHLTKKVLVQNSASKNISFLEMKPAPRLTHWEKCDVAAEFQHWLAAEHHVGPFVTVVKNNGKNNQFNAKANVDTTEYKCTVANCNCRMRLSGPKGTYETRSTGPVSLQCLGTHTHQLQGWLQYYQLQQLGSGKKRKKGLPPYVKWMVTEMAEDPRMEPKSICRHVEEAFRSDPLLANQQNRNMIYK